MPKLPYFIFFNDDACPSGYTITPVLSFLLSSYFLNLRRRHQTHHSTASLLPSGQISRSGHRSAFRSSVAAFEHQKQRGENSPFRW